MSITFPKKPFPISPFMRSRLSLPNAALMAKPDDPTHLSFDSVKSIDHSSRTVIGFVRIRPGSGYAQRCSFIHHRLATRLRKEIEPMESSNPQRLATLKLAWMDRRQRSFVPKGKPRTRKNVLHHAVLAIPMEQQIIIRVRLVIRNISPIAFIAKSVAR